MLEVALPMMSYLDEWFERRFPTTTIGGGYYKEWAYRFQSNDPFAAMDRQSIRLLITIIASRHLDAGEGW